MHSDSGLKTSLVTQAKRALLMNIRRLATGFSFLMFGLGALDLAFVVFPVIMLTTTCGDKRRLRIQRAISWNFRLFLRLMQWLGVMRLQLEGVERLRKDRGVLIIANHPTLIDVVVLMAFLGDVDCVVKEGLNRNPFLYRVVRAAGYITNSGPEHLIRDCQDRLEQGRNLIIFPEGTRTQPGCCPHFQRGVARVAIQSGCRIRPVYLDCSPGTLAKGQRWYDIPERPFVFSLWVGDLMDVSPWQSDRMSVSIGSRRLTQFLEQHFIQVIQKIQTVCPERV